MTGTGSKTLPSADELLHGYRDFANFAMELVHDAARRPERLKFAVVAAHTALELFLKYYFVATSQAAKIQKLKAGTPAPDFNDYAQILGLFFSQPPGEAPKVGVKLAAKTELERILKARNHIVHRAQVERDYGEVSTIIVGALYFIHAVGVTMFEVPLFEAEEIPHSTRRLPKWWRAASERFVERLRENFGEVEAKACLFCKSRAVVSAEIFSFGTEDDDHWVCVSCFSVMMKGHQIALAACSQCGSENFWVEPLNCQGEQRYWGRCPSCEHQGYVRKCASCDGFYRPGSKDECLVSGKYYCGTPCDGK